MTGTERLLIDGSNLLHALGRSRGGPAPAATLVGRLRAVIPAAVRIELILDGAPDPGLRGTRIASGLTVRHSGPASADRLIERLVADLGGRKSLYSTSFYSREEFAATYGGAVYDVLKKTYDADGRLLDLYAKCVDRR